MQTIVLVRHTQPEIDEGVCYGQTDVPLPTDFTREAAEIFRRLGSLVGKAADSMRILSSPLQRCARLAEFFAAQNPRRHRVVQSDARLREMNFGAWEGRSWAEIEAQDGEALRRWMEDFVHTAPPGGETFHDLQRRACEALQEAIETTTEETAENNDVAATQTLVVVTHAGVIRALAAHYANLPLERAFLLAVNFGSIWILQRRAARAPEAEAQELRFALSALNC